MNTHTIMNTNTNKQHYYSFTLVIIIVIIIVGSCTVVIHYPQKRYGTASQSHITSRQQLLTQTTELEFMYYDWVWCVVCGVWCVVIKQERVSVKKCEGNVFVVLCCFVICYLLIQHIPIIETNTASRYRSTQRRKKR